MDKQYISTDKLAEIIKRSRQASGIGEQATGQYYLARRIADEIATTIKIEKTVEEATAFYDDFMDKAGCSLETSGKY